MVEDDKERQQHRDNLFFFKDLNEVYLLLDFVSGRPDRNLESLIMADPRQPNAWRSWDIISEVAKIRYPPSANSDTRAYQAAVLLVAKDHLSRLADPARASTIAYTAMFVDAEKESLWAYRCIKWISEQIFRLIKRFSKRNGNKSQDSGAEPVASPSTIAPSFSENARIDLAADTFPGLRHHARKFLKWRDWLIFISIGWLVLTALTYWDVALGRSELQRLDQLWKDRTAVMQAHPDLWNRNLCSWYNPNILPSWLPPDPPFNWDPTLAEAANKLAPFCQNLWYLDRAREETHTDLDRVFGFSTRGTRQSLIAVIIHPLCWGITPVGGIADEGIVSPNASERESERRVDHIHWESATSILLVFTTYILPLMFGVLGTLIGAFRGIQMKVRDSELAPRDFSLTLMGIPMGAVAGIAVGLYFSPTSLAMPGSGGVGGELTLSAGGLGFLAGYGVRTFFRFMDWVLSQLFPDGRPAPAVVSHPPLLPPMPPPVTDGVTGGQPSPVAPSSPERQAQQPAASTPSAGQPQGGAE
jgi:hypothetical protein